MLPNTWQALDDNTSTTRSSGGKKLPPSPAPPPTRYPYGCLGVDELVEGLTQAGMVDVRLEEDAGGCIITIESEDAVLQLVLIDNDDIVTSRVQGMHAT
ncbi:hypothetical protein FHG87_020504 [Trinorchestia longiramus]|nr:hypothetical protein FHG87_020504 [Trinorchestia longiramus]